MKCGEKSEFGHECNNINASIETNPKAAKKATQEQAQTQPKKRAKKALRI
jgi:hypothetical protein